MANSNLTNAKNAKNDEFYTQWIDIEKEINAYFDLDPDVFKGKTILCPCDDPYESNFFKYFALWFNQLKLKKLIATCYAGSPIANTQLSLFEDENKISQHFNSIAADKQEKILNTKLLIYECEGTESEIKEWFRTINIAGVPLNDQELLNAVYSGTFVTLGKEEFSNSQNSNIQKWSAYIAGSANRQDFFERALDWVSKGIFEYILGGSTNTNLLDVRVFDEATKKSVYAIQTEEAEEKGISNCPLCAIGHDSNKSRIWKLTEMDADHVAAWSKGGATDTKNCQMLCKTHNRAKGNK